MLCWRSRVCQHVALPRRSASYGQHIQHRTLRSATIRHPRTAKVKEQSAEDKLNARIDWHRKVSLYGALAIAGILGLYTAQLAYSFVKASRAAEPIPLSEQKDVAERYEEIADTFDSDVNYSEWLMGILRCRDLIAKGCIGNVLEVSCGTGRNLGYFDLDAADKKMTSLTLLDLSPQMIQVCKRKLMALRAGRPGRKGGMPIRFAVGSALDSLPLAPDGAKYDTIIQTMGLCSTPAPTELVVNMAKHLNVDNPEARIYLLEHGRAHYQWLNNILDNSAQKHAEVYGCWYNRELDEIVRSAAKQAGLEIVSAERYHLGTTYLYELKASSTTAALLQEAETTASTTQSAQAIWRKWFSIDTKEGT